MIKKENEILEEAIIKAQSITKSKSKRKFY